VRNLGLHVRWLVVTLNSGSFLRTPCLPFRFLLSNGGELVRPPWQRSTFQIHVGLFGRKAYPARSGALPIFSWLCRQRMSSQGLILSLEAPRITRISTCAGLLGRVPMQCQDVRELKGSSSSFYYYVDDIIVGLYRGLDKQLNPLPTGCKAQSSGHVMSLFLGEK
jgi:hypothetical protein